MRKVVSQFGQGPLQQKLTAGDLHFLSDAEVSKGGSDTGPSPHEYLGAALAACTSMTLKMYAGRKEMKLDNAIVTVDIERNDDVETFSREIQLQGNLSAEEKERLLEIADKCPIHKALAGQIQIKTQLVN
ncbi:MULTISPECIES: OsmC family protein [unclassified Polynucleobacter]|jgi:putative redox protein|uniref:OsmC family protein n=1 Tax=unclassified Polynucleobacter TaxID=2640945 RepID=UPI001BFDD8CD|nr:MULTISPECIES: OsmC family protein [unclassified Polynucleobacter]MBU3548621.1 OsmC family protein [Polynucleobacter sp. P1-05-14]MBU3637971.1 OsmC family protein [Polynucleobacter sp. AP-RePozz3-80-G7]QWD81380.1 OsmC family protein [Polynucleobacter sp. MWH-S4W17]